MLQAGQVKTLPTTSSPPDPVKHRSVLWPDSSASCSLSSSKSNPEAFTEFPPLFEVQPHPWKGNRALTPACGCLESLLCALLRRHKELDFVFL